MAQRLPRWLLGETLQLRLSVSSTMFLVRPPKNPSRSGSRTQEIQRELNHPQPEWSPGTPRGDGRRAHATVRRAAPGVGRGQLCWGYVSRAARQCLVFEPQTLSRLIYDFWTMRGGANSSIMSGWKNKHWRAARETIVPRRSEPRPTPRCCAPHCCVSTTSVSARSAWRPCRPRWFSSRWISWSASPTSKGSSAASPRTWSRRLKAAAAASG